MGILKCAARFLWYWFRYPTGYPVSGHAYVERRDGWLVCADCGHIANVRTRR